MRRRDVLSLLGGAAMSWPLRARAQQSAVPVVGFVSSLSPGDLTFVMPAFHQGLNAAGFDEGHNVSIEYRWAESHYDRLSALSADLVRRQVAVIAAISGTPAALAAKAATTSIPNVFAIGGDPVAPGLVTSLSRPGGNITGASFYTSPVVTKRLELARELIPRGTRIAALGQSTKCHGRQNSAGCSRISRPADPDRQRQQGRPDRWCLCDHCATKDGSADREF